MRQFCSLRPLPIVALLVRLGWLNFLWSGTSIGAHAPTSLPDAVYFIDSGSVSKLLARDLSHGEGVVKGALRSPPSATLEIALILFFFCNTTQVCVIMICSCKSIAPLDICVRVFSVCAFVRVCICMYMCVRVCLCIYVCMCVCMCLYASRRVCVHVCACMYVFVCERACVCICVRAWCVRACVCMFVNMSVWQNAEDISECVKYYQTKTYKCVCVCQMYECFISVGV